MKTIKRTESMPTWAKYTAIDKNGELNLYAHKNIEADKDEWIAKEHFSAMYEKLKSIPDYKGNWEKSLRKITNKPTRKELHEEIAKLNRTNNTNDVLLKNAYDKIDSQMVEIGELNNSEESAEISIINLLKRLEDDKIILDTVSQTLECYKLICEYVAVDSERKFMESNLFLIE